MSTTSVPSHFHAGSNDPGYLPDSEPACFDSFDDAKRYLIGEMLSDAESVASWGDVHDCDDVPCPTYGDECPESKASELTFAAEDLNLEGGPEYGVIVGGRSYWIAQPEDPCEAEPDLAELEAQAKARNPWPKTPSMTRADFAYLARIIAGLPTVATRDDVAQAFAYHLGDTCPRFDRGRFVGAATK